MVALLCATGLNRALAERIARDLPKDQRRKATPATLTLFAERNLAVSYLGTGQRVPEDLERATPHNLARHIVGHDASERDLA